ncbi:MAG: tyrosine recombinase XerA [Geothermobacteraceae bacterium]
MLTELLEKYCRHLGVLRGLSDWSVEKYRVKVEEFFTWMKENDRTTDPTKVTRTDIEDYLESIFYRGNGNATRRVKLLALQHFFRFLVYERIIQEDITADIPRPKIKSKLVQKFSKDEVLRCFAVWDINTKYGLRNICILILLAFCGARTGEIINLRIEDITDDGNNIDIRLGGKHDHYRIVYLWKAPSAILRQWLILKYSQNVSPRDLVFVSFRNGDVIAGNKLGSRDIDVMVKKTTAMAGIRKARTHAHMFRATHASDLRYIRGYDIAAIAERLGHKSISTTDRYLPSRGRINREWPSLAAYWSEFPKIWIKEED